MANLKATAKELTGRPYEYKTEKQEPQQGMEFASAIKELRDEDSRIRTSLGTQMNELMERVVAVGNHIAALRDCLDLDFEQDQDTGEIRYFNDLAAAERAVADAVLASDEAELGIETAAERDDRYAAGLRTGLGSAVGQCAGFGPATPGGSLLPGLDHELRRRRERAIVEKALRHFAELSGIKL